MTSPRIDLVVNGTGAWPDLADRAVTDGGTEMKMVGLPAGMSRGRVAVAIRIDGPGRQSVIVQTSLQLLTAAVKALNAAYPDDADAAP